MYKLSVAASLIGSVVCFGSGVQHVVATDDSRSVPADPSFGMSVVEMRALNEEHRAAPIVLPVEMPHGYGWVGIGEEQGDGQQVWARTSQFTSVDGEPVVEVCARPAVQEFGCEQDDDAYLTRSVDGLKVFISLSSSKGDVPPETRSFWASVEMTTDYGAVRWLAQ
jgi:hypothetical protein